MGQRGLSWHCALPPEGSGDAGKVKLFFLPTEMYLFLEFFLQGCAGTSLLDSQAPTKIFFSMGGCQNQFLEEVGGGKEN